MTTTYTTRIFSDTITITADFTQASSPITGDISGGYQVADFRHSPAAAMRRALEQLVEASGDSIEDYALQIDRAVGKMVEV